MSLSLLWPTAIFCSQSLSWHSKVEFVCCLVKNKKKMQVLLAISRSKKKSVNCCAYGLVWTREEGFESQQLSSVSENKTSTTISTAPLDSPPPLFDLHINPTSHFISFFHLPSLFALYINIHTLSSLQFLTFHCPNFLFKFYKHIHTISIFTFFIVL